MTELACAVPYRDTEEGVELLVITSRKRGDWILPKGNLDEGDTAPEAAAREAWEEAGVLGDLNENLVVEYNTSKNGSAGRNVEVFLLRVEEIRSRWPEKTIRRRKWVPLPKVSKYIRRKNLRRILPEIKQAVQAEIAVVV